MEEGTFSQWLKQDGDAVAEGDALFELESDKAVQAVESFDAGILRIPLTGPKPGDIVKVGQCLGYLCRAGEALPGSESKASPPATAVDPVRRPTQLPDSAAAGSKRVCPPANNGQVDPSAAKPYQGSPSVRRLARQMGIDVEQMQRPDNRPPQLSEQVANSLASSSEVGARVSVSPGQPIRVSPRAACAAVRLGVQLHDVSATGSSGRIRERDVVAAAEKITSNTATATEVVLPAEAIQTISQPFVEVAARPLPPAEAAATSARRTIAMRMLAAAQETAAVTLTSVAEASELVNFRRQFKSADLDGTRPGPTYTDMFVMLVAAALEKHPALRQQWEDGRIVLPDGVHVAVAVDTPHGLLTPVLRDVPSLPLAAVSAQLADLISRTRSRRLSAAEMQGGTFTISNLGGYRVDAFTPLLNLPQTAILGIGRINPQPVAIGERLEVRACVSLSLTFDHRVVDGAAAAGLLTTICELVESPLPTLVR